MKELPKTILDRVEHYAASKNFSKSKTTKLIDVVTNRYNAALVSPGDAMGIIAAQSIGEPGTQLTLRTKHYAGSLEVSVGRGIQRVIEIVDARLTTSYPEMTIYLKPEFSTSDSKVVKIAHNLVHITLNDVGYFTEDFDQKQVSFHISEEKIKEFGKDKEEVMDLIYDKINDTYDSKRFTGNKSNINFTFTKGTPLYTIRKAILKWGKIPLFGIKGIEKVVVVKEKNEFVIKTKGTNLAVVLKLPEVDSERTITNDIMEINKVLGIEAARQAIVDELLLTFNSNNITINPRHIYILADLMCYTGKVKGIVRTGITGAKASPFARAAFEETVKHLINAAFYHETENLKGITENIIVGQPISAGTGNVKLTLDPKNLQKIMKKQEELIEKKEENSK